MNNTKIYLDSLVEKYENKDFICDDPVQFMHRYDKKADKEISAFIASLFAYGKREIFIEKLNYIFNKMNNRPFEFVAGFDFRLNALDDCDYRFSRGTDLKQIVILLHKLYKDSSLEDLFAYGWSQTATVQGMLQCVADYFYSGVELPVTKGYFHLLPNPCKGSACKRLNMFLRWMVRDGVVDSGLWTFMPKSELIIPLDVHVANVSRELGLLNRSQNDWISAKELTRILKSFCPTDPVKYDFAMFGYGVNR